jgi:serine/threonine protein kinase
MLIQCPACAAEVAADSRFCAGCGQPIHALSEMPTMGQAATAPTLRVSQISSDSIPVGGFTPGVVLANRYRIIGLLGRGGMGEVYRSDDLKLGQPVALKFLPKALASDAVRRERFFAEVRITRQLSHPNICRVYDIAEFNGQHFLSMEYIDGEDLASLIRRIGYLSNEKALDIARQLAAGLAAAHERGVLHRDLKPANIMIDGRGRVRITDFGLAVAAGDKKQSAEIFGTPAYMAPEQFTGNSASVRSDIYAMGLVLYETYCGKRAFTATTIAKLREQKERQTPRAPSGIREGVDPVVERLIMRCLERDPHARPASVAQLVVALPGGDPLAAAIAAGETPSPEMVAASRPKEGLRPAIALGLLACVLVGSVLVTALKDRTETLTHLPSAKPRDVLIERARDFIRKNGYSAEPVDAASGFDSDANAVRYVEQASKMDERWNRLASVGAVLFWYRESPRPLERSDFLRNATMDFSGILRSDPQMHFSGEVLVRLGSEGHLRGFQAIPPQQEPLAGSPLVPDWDVLFSEAGLDESKWLPAASQWTPLHYADTRAAWQGSLPGLPDIPVRIEAAAYRGKPVSFEIVGPWTRADGMPKAVTIGDTIVLGSCMVLLFVLIVGGLFFAHRNVRFGRGDRRGAARLALFVVVLSTVSWIFAEHHVPTLWELYLFVAQTSFTLFYSTLLLAALYRPGTLRSPPMAPDPGVMDPVIVGRMARSVGRPRRADRLRSRCGYGLPKSPDAMGA